MQPNWVAAATLLALLHVIIALLPALFDKRYIPFPVVAAVGIIVLLWMFLKWILSAGILCSFCFSLCGDSLSRSFRDALIVVVYSSTVNSLALSLSAGFGMVQWITGKTDRFQFVSFLSAKTACQSLPMGETLSSILGQVNIFAGWYLLVLTIGIMTVYSLKVRTAFLFGFTIWFFWMVIQSGIQDLLKLLIASFSP